MSDIYTKPLTHLINISISEGQVPEERKTAKVIPIYKEEDDKLIQNSIYYIYISLQSTKSLKHIFIMIVQIN